MLELQAETKAKAHAPRSLTRFPVAAQHVRHEVQWAQGSRRAPLDGQHAAEAAVGYVVGHVSTGACGYQELVYDETPGGSDLPPYLEDLNTIPRYPDGHLRPTRAHLREDRRGSRLPGPRYRVRFVDPNGASDSHSAAEAYYGDGWHFFDPTFGQFWPDGAGNVLSIVDVRTGSGMEHRNGASFKNVVEDAAVPSGDDTWFETEPTTTVSVVAGRRRTGSGSAG